MNELHNLTIISITHNNPGIFNTFNSLKPLLNLGAHYIIQNGGHEIEINFPKVLVETEKDFGIYNALNRSLEKVNTQFFMLIHAGDTFIGLPQDIINILKDLDSKGLDLSLNSQTIGKRLHSSTLWRPWMLFMGAQPPHLPCVYRSKPFCHRKYRENLPIIADFDFFLTQISWDKVIRHNHLLVQMETGGHTSSGISSFFTVSKLLIINYGLKGVFMAMMRAPLKIVQSIK